MIADFDDFVTWMFVIIDDLWQPIADLYQRPGPEPTSASDSEIITVAVVSECRGWDCETRAMQKWAAYRHLFPHLPQRSRFNRRRRNLMLAINQLRRIVLPLLVVAQDSYGVIDSIPVPVVQFHLAPQRSREWDAHGARFGYCASKKQTFFGYRLHVAVILGGVILDFELSAANESDNAFRPLASGYDGETVRLADQGLRAKDAPQSNIKLCERNTWNERFTIETDLSWVTELFHSKKLYHRVREHLEARLWYLAALLNCLLRLTEQKRSLAQFVI